MTELVKIEPQASSLMEVIARAASDPNTDIEKLERLMAMHERIMAKQAEERYDTAMSLAQSEMRPISQDASNPQTRSKYASYHALDNAMRPIYTRHGFSLSFDTADVPEPNIRVICKVSCGGHAERPHLDMPADGKGAKGGDVMTKTHATMSAVTYAKRGLLKMIFNIAEGDDDGNRAHGGGALTAAQLAEIRKLIEETGADVERFCAFLKVDAVVDIAARDYDKAISALKAKGAKK